MSANQVREITLEAFEAEGRRLFGEDIMAWRFVCPACGHVASVQDYKDAGAPEGAVGFSCIGRYTGPKRTIFEKDKPGPCDYTSGGLFNFSPVLVGSQPCFDFDRSAEVYPVTIINPQEKTAHEPD